MIGISQMQTCYVLYNRNEKKIYIDVASNSIIESIKNDHLKGMISETNGWFNGKDVLTNNDFQEIKDDFDEKIDAEAFVFNVVSQISVKGYTFIVSERLEKYKSQIIQAYKRQNDVNVALNRLQGNVGSSRALEYLINRFQKDNVFSEIAVQTSDGTISRLDYLVYDKPNFIVFEVKTGNASCTDNQRRAFPLICREGFIIKANTDNGKKFPNRTIGGKRRNDKIGSTNVKLIDDSGVIDGNFCNCSR